MANNIELLTEVEDFAYKYLSKEDISLITGVDVLDLSDRENMFGRSFIKGRLKRKAELNHRVMKLTDQLSSPAMAIEFKMAEQTFLNDQR